MPRFWTNIIGISLLLPTLVGLSACPADEPEPSPSPTPNPTVEPDEDAGLLQDGGGDVVDDAGSNNDAGDVFQQDAGADAGKRVDGGPVIVDSGVWNDGGFLEADAGMDAGSLVEPEPEPPIEPPLDPEPMQISARGNVIWKRTRLLRNDLMRVLELEEDQLCRELGQRHCYYVHLVALGANSPYSQSQYLPVEKPGVITPNAFDRFVLGACESRLQLDLTLDETSEETRLFSAIPLDVLLTGTEPGVDEHIQDLYRRFFQRDPLTEELLKVRELLTDVRGRPLSGADFALLTCYAIGTTVENVFY